MPRKHSTESHIESIRRRLLEKIHVNEATGCWEWAGFIPPYPRNYGRLAVNKKSRETHRLMYEVTFGQVPDGFCVCHKCDVRKCVNPDHLFLGTKADNAADAKAKGRMASGEKHGSKTHPESRPNGENNHAKLTWEQVREIRALLLSGISFSKVAKRFGIGKTAVANIKHGRKWKEHLDR